MGHLHPNTYIFRETCSMVDEFLKLVQVAFKLFQRFHSQLTGHVNGNRGIWNRIND